MCNTIAKQECTALHYQGTLSIFQLELDIKLEHIYNIFITKIISCVDDYHFRTFKE